MGRPTLLQSVFNRPSQSYLPDNSLSEQVSAGVEHNSYYSAKPELMRIAHQQRRTLSLPTRPSSAVLKASPAAPIDVDSFLHQGSDTDTDADTDDVFYTPNTSPRISVDDSILNSPQKSVSHAETITSLSLSSPNLPLLLQDDIPSDSLSVLSAASSMDSLSNFSFSSKPSDLTPLTSLAPSSSDSMKTSSYRIVQQPIASQTNVPRRKAASQRQLLSQEVDDTSSVIPVSSSTVVTDLPSILDDRRNAYQVVCQQIRNSNAPKSAIRLEIIRSSSSSRDTPSRTSRGRRTRVSKSLHQESIIASSSRMSAVMEEEELEETLSRRTSGSSQSHRRQSEQRKRSRGEPLELRRARVSVVKVDIPEPPPLLGRSAPASFTQLVLPRAGYRPTDVPYKDDGTVDLISLGLAQTTMTCIEIQKNAALKIQGIHSATISKRFTRTLTRDSATPHHLDTLLPPTLCLASHLSPPTRITPNQVLVQVWAVALDGMDGLIIEEKSQSLDCAGFVPGRSFVGRAIDVGYAVTAIGRGEWVMGLTEARKCGALTEFIVVDKRRAFRAPHPTKDLTPEQIAILPLCGVSAQRALTSFRASFRTRGSEVLVLQCHKGPGALVCQALTADGARVTGQIPPNDDTAHRSATANGALTVVSDDHWNTLESLPSSKYDAVLDTVGGPKLWKLCRRVLKSGGQFTTVVGDSHSSKPSISLQFRSNFRSLRQTFIQKDRKKIGYNWVSCVADLDQMGEDVHDTLSSITAMAERGIYRPHADYVLNFENVVHSFPKALQAGNAISDIVIVKLIG